MPSALPTEVGNVCSNYVCIPARKEKSVMLNLKHTQFLTLSCKLYNQECRFPVSDLYCVNFSCFLKKKSKANLQYQKYITCVLNKHTTFDEYSLGHAQGPTNSYDNEQML